MPPSDQRLVVGVVGHVDHGKTALVRALTGIDTDRLPEEKRRGISIALGFAHLTLAGGVIDLIDMPGHERFVRTLIAGATGIDAVLLTVAADDGIKPQTVEHLDIVSLLGIRRAVIVLTKADLADPDRLRDIGAAAAALCREREMTASPPLPIVAPAGQGLDALRDALAALWHTAEMRPDRGAPFLPVDRAFSVAGHGTVVTGTLRGGLVQPGDELALWPGGTTIRVRAVQVRGGAAPEGLPGQRVALNLRGTEAASVRPGSSLVASGMLAPSRWLTVSLRLVADAPALPGGARLRMLAGTSEVEARLRLLCGEAMAAGTTGFAQLSLAEPIAIPAREGVILRLPSPPRTVAGGMILDTAPVRLRRNDPVVLARLARLAGPDLPAALYADAQASGLKGVPLRRLASLAAMTTACAAALLAGAPVLVLPDGTVVTAAALDAATARVATALEAEPAPVTAKQLAALVPEASAPVLAAAIARLVRSGVVGRDGSTLVLARGRQADREAAVLRRLAKTLRDAGLTPPDPAALAPDVQTRRALARLVRDGVAVRTSDRVQKRELVFHADTVAAARRALAPLLAPPGLKVGQAGAALGISRKYAVPLLEYLDSVQFTRRVDDRRVLMSP